MTVQLAAATYAYPDVATEDRARLASALLEHSVPTGAFVLATCLRVEVFVSGDETALQAVLTELFGDVVADVSPVVRRDEAAAVHLYRVASGLDSPIVGERDVLVQFRRAARSAQENGVSGMLARCLEDAVAAARRVHAMLPEGAHDSIATVAADLVAGHEQVAVFGAGIMGSSVVRALAARPDGPKLTVVTRSPHRVTQADVDVWPFERAAEALAEMPAVVSATSAKQRLLGSEELTAILDRRVAPVTLVDMAMPPDLAPHPSPDVTYVDIDQLADRVAPQPHVRKAEEEACRAAADMYHRRRTHSERAPVMAAMMASADAIVDEAVQRFAGRLESEADTAVLRQAAHTVARKLLAGPVAYLNDTETPDHAIDAVADAFGASD